MPPQAQPAGESTVRMPDGSSVPFSEAQALVDQMRGFGAPEAPEGPGTALPGAEAPAAETPAGISLFTPPGQETPGARFPSDQSATGDLEDFQNLLISGIPLVTGLATGGASVPAQLGATGLAGIIQALLQGKDPLSGGLTEAAITGVPFGIGRAAKPLMRGAISLASGVDEASRLATRTGTDVLNPVRHMADEMLKTGATLTPRGFNVSREAADKAFTAARGQMRGGAGVSRQAEIADPVARLGRDLLRKASQPHTARRGVESAMAEIAEFPQTVPLNRALEIARQDFVPVSSPENVAAILHNATIQAFRTAVTKASGSQAAQQGIQSDALAESIKALLTRSGLVPSVGGALGRGGLVALGAAPLAVVNPALASTAGGAGFFASAPGTMSRIAQVIQRIGQAGPAISAVTRGGTGVAPAMMEAFGDDGSREPGESTVRMPDGSSVSFSEAQALVDQMPRSQRGIARRRTLTP